MEEVRRKEKKKAKGKVNEMGQYIGEKGNKERRENKRRNERKQQGQIDKG